jgi:sialic acid synthase SpsE
VVDFIAEVCSNHNNDLDRALRLIDTAARIGCRGVKFQLFRIDKLFTPTVLWQEKYQFLQERRKWELPLKWLPVLANRAHEKGLLFGCTPFYLEAVDELLPYVDFYKVASYNLLDTRLLGLVGTAEKPVILSTGMATIAEVSQAQRTVIEAGASDITLLHCVSSYPTEPEQCHWRFMQDLKAIAGSGKVGWSDHTTRPGVIYYFTLAQGAQVVEFHLDLDGDGAEYNQGHCWLPYWIERVIEGVNDAERVSENNRLVEFSEAEQQERLWRADPADGLRPVKEARSQL